jgi:uncharacterized protein (DUF1778 family)
MIIDNRTELVSFRVNKDELSMLKAAASKSPKAYTSLSGYLRDVVMQHCEQQKAAAK